MRTHRIVQRLAALSIMVGSAALPAGVAYSADNGEAPPVTTKTANVTNLADTSKRPVADDPGLPTKPIAVIQVKVTPAPATLTPVPAPPAPAAEAPQPATARTTTTKVVSTPAKKTATTTTKTTPVAAPAAPAAPAVAPAAPAGSVKARQDLAGAVAAATNAQRAAAGLAPLTYRSCSVPAAWAIKLATSGTLTHNSLTTVLSACGGTSTAGENIAAGYTSVSAVTAGWMGSAGHRANILNPKFKNISVGVAQAANGTYYWVENFTG